MATTIMTPMPNQDDLKKPDNVICIDAGRLRLERHKKLRLRQDEMKNRPEPEQASEWQDWRKHSIAIAKQSCSNCMGLGHVSSKSGAAVCECVLRAIFRQCFQRFRKEHAKEGWIGKITYDLIQSHRKNGSGNYSLRSQEFQSDFYLLAFRALNDGLTREQLTEQDKPVSIYWRVFSMHYLLGADWRVVSAKLGIDRGNFYHMCYRIEALLGAFFASTVPFALFPVDEYFSPGVPQNRGGVSSFKLPKIRGFKQKVA